MDSLFVDLSCSECPRRYPAQLQGLCVCGGPLLARYEGFADPPKDGGLWDWQAWLPPCEPVSLGEVATPLISLGGDGIQSGAPRDRSGAFLKDEGRLPTGTFKARGAAVGVSMAKQLGAEGVVLPTAGNAGSAWAAYAAKAGIGCAVVAASGGAPATLEMARLTGAEVLEVDGGMDQAAIEATLLAQERGWHYAATFKEPWRVEGKKTAFFEIYRELGRIPDVVVFPVGGGVGLIAAYLAAMQLRSAGWGVGMPRLFAAQAEGCAPVVKAFEEGQLEPARWDEPETAAAGIRIPLPPAGKLLMSAIRKTAGGAVAVSEQEILSARESVARRTGIILGLEASTAAAGYLRLKRAGTFGDLDTVVIYGTGSGRI